MASVSRRRGGQPFSLIAQDDAALRCVVGLTTHVAGGDRQLSLDSGGQRDQWPPVALFLANVLARERAHQDLPCLVKIAAGARELSLHTRQRQRELCGRRVAQVPPRLPE